MTAVGAEREPAAERGLTAAQTPAPAAFRAVQVLEAISHGPSPITITQIAAAIPLAKSSVSNLLVSLEAAGMVRRAGAGWALSYKALEIGQSVLSSTDLITEFRRLAAQQPHLSRETVLLAVLDGDDVLYLARHDGQQAVRLASDIGRRLPAVVTALGKAMLAGLPPDELDSRLAALGPLPRPTSRSHRSIVSLRRDLDAIGQRGFAMDDEENTAGVTCFGVEIPGARQPTAVSTTLLTGRATPQLRDRLLADLTTLATSLGAFARA